VSGRFGVAGATGGLAPSIVRRAAEIMLLRDRIGGFMRDIHTSSRQSFADQSPSVGEERVVLTRLELCRLECGASV